jgi:hypothetical protein
VTNDSYDFCSGGFARDSLSAHRSSLEPELPRSWNEPAPSQKWIASKSSRFSKERTAGVERQVETLIASASKGHLRYEQEARCRRQESVGTRRRGLRRFRHLRCATHAGVSPRVKFLRIRTLQRSDARSQFGRGRALSKVSKQARRLMGSANTKFVLRR